MNEILEILKRTPARLEEARCSRLPQAVKNEIKKLEKAGVILKYKTIINKNCFADQALSALISKVALKNLGLVIQRGCIVSKFKLLSHVQHTTLGCGKGKHIHKISKFCSGEVVPRACSRGTVTHFILKKYKEVGDILRALSGQGRYRCELN